MTLGSGSQGGLFLDLDGTLADSLRVMRAVYDGFLTEHGRTGSTSEFARLNGPSLRDVVENLRISHHLDAPADTLLHDYQARIADAYRAVVPNRGAEELIAAAKQRGRKVAVVTSNTFDQTSLWLKNVGLADKVSAVVTGDMVARGKPHPDIYLRALEACACVAKASIAVEDTPMGAAAAAAAGLQTFGLQTADTRAEAWPIGVQLLERLDLLMPHL